MLKRKPPVPKPPPGTAIDLLILAELEGINETLFMISASLECICTALAKPEVVDFDLKQLKGDVEMGQITGVPVGANANFHILPVPPNGAPLQSGPTATADNPGVTVGPTVQEPGNPFAINIAVADGVVEESFSLTVDGTSDRGNAVSHTFVIPIIAGPAPEIVDFDLDQDAVTLSAGRSGGGLRTPAARPAARPVGRR